MSRIGIFPGSFDPIHEGHLAFALKALDFGIDTVYFMPEQAPRKKPKISNLTDRKKVIEQAISGKEKLGLIALDQKVFSVEHTLSELDKLFPGDKLSLLIGDDVLRTIHQWEKLEELARKVELLVATRSHFEKEIDQIFSDLYRFADFKYQIIELNNKISSTQIRSKTVADEL